MTKTSPENNIGSIHDLEGVPSYDADEFYENEDAATVEHGVAVTASDDSARKSLEVDNGEVKKSMWSVRFIMCVLC